MPKKESEARIYTQRVMGLFLPVILIGGWFYPYIGFVVLAMIAGGFVALGGKIINVFHEELLGNLIIISSFILNSILLFFSFNSMLKRTK